MNRRLYSSLLTVVLFQELIDIRPPLQVINSSITLSMRRKSETNGNVGRFWLH